MWQVNMKGCEPSYYSNYRDALEKYAYLSMYFTHCSLVRINRKKLVKNMYR